MDRILIPKMLQLSLNVACVFTRISHCFYFWWFKLSSDNNWYLMLHLNWLFSQGHRVYLPKLSYSLIFCPVWLWRYSECVAWRLKKKKPNNNLSYFFFEATKSTHFSTYMGDLKNYNYMEYGETFEEGMFLVDKMSYRLILIKGRVC